MQLQLDTIYNMDCLEGMKLIPDGSVDCCVTSPPYFALRDYGVDGQIGLEQSPEEYIGRLCDAFREVLRVMKPTATCWVVIGDSYAGSNKGAARYPMSAFPLVARPTGWCSTRLWELPPQLSLP